MDQESSLKKKTQLLDYPCPEFIAALEHYLHESRRSGHYVAKRLGISAMTFTNWRRGARPGLEKIQKLCGIFDVRLSEFFAKGEELVAEAEARQRRELSERAQRVMEKFPTAEELAQAIDEQLDDETKLVLVSKLMQIDAIKVQQARLRDFESAQEEDLDETEETEETE